MRIRIDTHLSTRYAYRPLSIAPVCERNREQFRELPGNYLALFSSYSYASQVLEHLKVAYPDIDVMAQQPGMSESARTHFLESLTQTTRQIRFCVLGGAFGEGIDLPGARLIGAFITTLGLPAKNEIKEELMRRKEV